MTGTNRTPESERVEPSSKDESDTVANKDLSTNELSYLHLEAMEELVGVMKDLRNMLANDNELTDLREPQEATTPDGEPVKDKYVLDAEEAAETLQEAYEEKHDMQVTANEGLVWIQTGKESPGWAFDAFLKDPEQVEFIHDNHDEFGKKPGEWWKNAIVPSDVDEYIEEHL